MQAINDLRHVVGDFHVINRQDPVGFDEQEVSDCCTNAGNVVLHQESVILEPKSIPNGRDQIGNVAQAQHRNQPQEDLKPLPRPGPVERHDVQKCEEGGRDAEKQDCDFVPIHL